MANDPARRGTMDMGAATEGHRAIGAPSVRVSSIASVAPRRELAVALEMTSKCRLLGRYFAAKRDRLREAATEGHALQCGATSVRVSSIASVAPRRELAVALGNDEQMPAARPLLRGETRPPARGRTTCASIISRTWEGARRGCQMTATDGSPSLASRTSGAGRGTVVSSPHRSTRARRSLITESVALSRHPGCLRAPCSAHSLRQFDAAGRSI